MKRVMIGLSGGVDSSVAAARLQAQGYEVIGVFIKVWHPDFLVCDWEAERRDAMRVAAHLGIPFLTCDAEKAYYNEVAQYFINAYRSGLTPNPDVMCNRAVKFGVFWEFAQSHQVDLIATGHYAQNIHNKQSNIYELHRGVDSNKDQSYFLWTLTSQDLEHIVFPIGNTTKEQVRTEAKKYNLPTATKHDSQGICFLGHINISDFLGHFIDLEPGEVCDETGRVIGSHRGSICYTLGQRHGFVVTAEKYATAPLYVTAIDHTRNMLTVSLQPATLKAQATLTLKETNIDMPTGSSIQCKAQVRYRQKPVPAKIYVSDAQTAIVSLDESICTAAAGQSCVLYQGDQCIGGGIIQ